MKSADKEPDKPKPARKEGEIPPKEEIQPDLEDARIFRSIVDLLPRKDQRDVVKIYGELITNKDFREKFWADPAGALIAANISAEYKVVDKFMKADRDIINKIVRDSVEIYSRSKAFTWEGEPVAAIPLAVAAGVLAGAVIVALVTEVLHHHFSEVE